MEYFATIVWMVWFHRNSLRTGSKTFLIHQVIPHVWIAQAVYVCGVPPKPPDLTTCVPQRVIWKPPPWVYFQGEL